MIGVLSGWSPTFRSRIYSMSCVGAATAPSQCSQSTMSYDCAACYARLRDRRVVCVCVTSASVIYLEIATTNGNTLDRVAYFLAARCSCLQDIHANTPEFKHTILQASDLKQFFDSAFPKFPTEKSTQKRL
ncbi:hypothetical protein RRG08_051646 [Elysia crispata]|uniref:Uncharacterized protein n=1 Tax=Elysia crispata TaxID=231223 RepID=A0AAE1A3C7_9GAST|nr:hypothetical protein RRG08_051646 [Elysia crispata]